MFFKTKRFKNEKQYFHRDGVAKNSGAQTLCRKKLSFFSTDLNLLFDLMYELSHEQDCLLVKVSKEVKSNIHLGHCYFTGDAAIGSAWAKYKSNPNFWITIENDDFSDLYKQNIRRIRQFSDSS